MFFSDGMKLREPAIDLNYHPGNDVKVYPVFINGMHKGLRLNLTEVFGYIKADTFLKLYSSFGGDALL